MIERNLMSIRLYFCDPNMKKKKVMYKNTSKTLQNNPVYDNLAFYKNIKYMLKYNTHKECGMKNSYHYSYVPYIIDHIVVILEFCTLRMASFRNTRQPYYKKIEKFFCKK